MLETAVDSALQRIYAHSLQNFVSRLEIWIWVPSFRSVKRKGCKFSATKGKDFYRKHARHQGQTSSLWQEWRQNESGRKNGQFWAPLIQTRLRLPPKIAGPSKMPQTSTWISQRTFGGQLRWGPRNDGKNKHVSADIHGPKDIHDTGGGGGSRTLQSEKLRASLSSLLLQSFPQNMAHHSVLFRRPRVGRWIRGRWILRFGGPRFLPKIALKPFNIRVLGVSGLKIGAPKNADSTTTDPTPHSRPSVVLGAKVRASASQMINYFFFVPLVGPTPPQLTRPQCLAWPPPPIPELC